MGTRARHPRFSPSHFAYLRAWVEGVDLVAAAHAYLGLDHAHQVQTLHREAVAELRALARRAGDSRWRLIGMDIGALSRSTEGASKKGGPPPLAEWVAAHGLDGWSQAEQLAMYAEAFPPEPGSKGALRKQERAARLRARQLAALKDLERTHATPALPSDPVDAWLEPIAAERLQRAGFSLLGEVQRAARLGGRWWRGMPGVGAVKARRIASYVDHLLTVASAPGGPMPAPGRLAVDQPQLPVSGGLPRLTPALDGSSGTNRAGRAPTIDAQTDLEAIRSWISARARSPATAAVYEREAIRWLLWCALERGKPLSSAGPDDCVEYMRFLNRIPDSWIGRGRRQRLGQGWTPFRGQLGLAGRRLAVKVLSLMCSWLVEGGRYLDANPWAAVNRSLVDGDELPSAPVSRALTPEAFDALRRHALAEVHAGALPAAARNRFLVLFTRHTGLRAAELLRARIADFQRVGAHWQLHVVGKGRKPRWVTIATPALRAVDEYLEARGLEPLGRCEATEPLLAAAARQGAAVQYAAVHRSFAAFVRRGLRHSKLESPERERCARATLHWLRHTFATRAAERAMPQDVLQAEMGHSNPGTTASYYRAQIQRRRDEVEKAAMD